MRKQRGLNAGEALFYYTVTGRKSLLRAREKSPRRNTGSAKKLPSSRRSGAIGTDELLYGGSIPRLKKNDSSKEKK